MVTRSVCNQTAPPAAEPGSTFEIKDLEGLPPLPEGIRPESFLEDQQLAPAFRKAIADLGVIAKSDAPVLVTGERGTGKELVARRIHAVSGRASFPFVAVNCAQLSDDRLEDDLFGHVRGVFSGAELPRRGLRRP